ncbi:YgfZ/GcvT domain-containing protein [Candidatus Liberibacter americanus]|uniref:Folate-dependent protein for Fe/S cluster synthesis/repair in oxidative stress n=1 Tax=Candidatus Liberibacter americanus str. Sao Paulo TaxID=1261131 RepID=U6B6D4_9HYPH|nr:folate-binding protein YgfZ [Candidatus Liberibacter americanus]AHA28339.1 Folate-dependent protein for Fe/S cluster synthesis/repair in oxidative stress [Candidatus Liberibacter americanus str. Sao Paulo]EMS36629.1 glycine cleavage system protein T [Candidatus Liberibacter americanus PW_SP]
MPSVYLPDKSFIKVSGKCSSSFLQRIITADVDSIPFGIARGSAVLTPQGKILFYFIISKIEENVFLLEIDESKCICFIEKLLCYKLRSDVVIELQKTNGVSIYWSHDKYENDSLVDERFLISSNIIVHRIKGRTKDKMSDPKRYHELRIDNGIVDPNFDFAPTTLFPHDIWMDALKGISFTKGCYIGQEVVSRIQHRSSIRKRSAIIIGDHNISHDSLHVIINNIKIGTIGIIIGKKALSVFRIDKLTEYLEKNLLATVNEIGIKIQFPFDSDLNSIMKDKFLDNI